MTTMRAKVRVSHVDKQFASQQTVTFNAVAKSDGPYPADGSDENNSFAKWSPMAEFKITIANPNLFDKFELNDQYYVDFSKADK